MAACKKYYEAILHFEELSEEEKDQIKQHIKECDDCRVHFIETQTITSALRQLKPAAHIDFDQLVQYGIYLSDPKHPDYDGEVLNEEQIANIKSHINRCSDCRNIVDEVKQEYEEIESFLKTEGVPDTTWKKMAPVRKKESQFSIRFTNFLDTIQGFLFPVNSRLVPAAIVVLLVLVWFSPLFRGSNRILSPLTTVDKGSVQYLTRGSGSLLLNAGLSAFQSDNYQKAIDNLERYCEQNGQNPDLAYVHEILGISYLINAKNDFLGRFRSYDKTEIEAGINHLNRVLQTSKNMRMREDAYWYLGKAFLIKNDETAARGAFNNVIHLNGKRAEAAQQMVEKLDELKTKR